LPDDALIIPSDRGAEAFEGLKASICRNDDVGAFGGCSRVDDIGELGFVGRRRSFFDEHVFLSSCRQTAARFAPDATRRRQQSNR
jgi:hypothetical protein